MTVVLRSIPVIVGLTGCWFDMSNVASPCQAHTECEAGLVCLEGRCKPASTCDANEQCPADLLCTGGRCAVPQQCEADTQCSADLVCRDGRCLVPTACEVRTECPTGFWCDDGLCLHEVFTNPLRLVFPTPTPTGINQHPTATGDALELYFTSTGPDGTDDIYVSQRLSRNASWGPLARPSFNSDTDADAAPGITGDGLTLYFASNRMTPSGDISNNIWMVTRASRSGAWSMPIYVEELSSPDGDFGGQPDDANLRFVLHRAEATSDIRRIFEATRNEVTDPWGPPIPLSDSINQARQQRGPCLANRDRELWFGRDVSNTPPAHDIFVATRANVTEPFNSGVLVGALNSLANDNDPWISPDGHVVFFTSDREGALDLYEVQR